MENQGTTLRVRRELTLREGLLGITATACLITVSAGVSGEGGFFRTTFNTLEGVLLGAVRLDGVAARQRSKIGRTLESGHGVGPGRFLKAREDATFFSTDEGAGPLALPPPPDFEKNPKMLCCLPAETT